MTIGDNMFPMKSKHMTVEFHKIRQINEAPSSVPTPPTSSEKVSRRKDLTEEERQEISKMSHPSQMPYPASKLKSSQIYCLEISNLIYLLCFIKTDNMVLRRGSANMRHFAVQSFETPPLAWLQSSVCAGTKKGYLSLAFFNKCAKGFEHPCPPEKNKSIRLGPLATEIWHAQSMAGFRLQPGLHRCRRKIRIMGEQSPYRPLCNRTGLRTEE